MASKQTETAIEKIIADCDGNIHGALEALLLVNEYLELELHRLYAATCCACRKSNSHVQMVKSAEKWRRQNATDGMCCSRRRRVFVDRKVRASLVIVGRVRSQQMAEMPLAEHDNVVKTFPPDRTDRPFTISVLPRRSRRGWPIPNAHRPKAADEDVTVDGVAVTNDVSRRYFPTLGLGELVRNPFSRWVRSHSQPQDLAAIVMQYQ